MTIKAYVLDALQKFWDKLKTTYVTDCETDDDNLALAASQGKELQDQITKVDRVRKQAISFCGNNVQITKSGHVVMLAFPTITPNPVLAANGPTYNVCTIPEAFRPKQDINVWLLSDVATTPGTGNGMVQLTIRGSTGVGEIYNWSSKQVPHNGSGWVRGCLTWIVDE